MQRLAFILLIFCAVISGATAPFAQRAAAMPATLHQHEGHADCAGRPAAGAGHHNTTAATDCQHGPKPIHPMLCAACFAIVADALPMPARDASQGHPAEFLPQALSDTVPQPQSPPPKSLLL